MNPTPSFSVIVCSIDAGKFAQVSAAYRRLLAGHRCEIIGIHDAASLAAGYNRGIQQASGDILIFSHDDILILDPDFASKILDRLQHFDLHGFAGTTKLISGAWVAADLPYLHGAIAHAAPKAPTLTLNVFGTLQWPVAEEIKAIDGLCMIAKREVALNVGFDAQAFDGFHLYDIDFSYSAYLAGYKIGVCVDIPIIHHSEGTFDKQHKHFASRFVAKHSASLDPDEYLRPVDHVYRAAAFQNADALKRTWQKEVLQRTSLAMWRHAGIPLPDLTPSSETFNKDAPLPVVATEEEPTDVQSTVDEGEIDKTSFSEKYQKWLSIRQSLCLAPHFPEFSDKAPTFQILLYLSAGEQRKLADTLDSLGVQHWAHWRLDILTELAAPDGLEDIPNICWHTLSEASSRKAIADAQVALAALDWVIEIPAGIRLDPLYMWRIIQESANAPATKAFFVDDDCVLENGERANPRFKPGCNPAALKSADLAGPICVDRTTWIGSGGASIRTGSPWFEKLLQVAKHHGWASIGHIPDILASYDLSFPSDTESCLLALVHHLDEIAPGSEIIPLSGQSWTIRHPYPASQRVTIALLSQGQLDILQRAFDSVTRLTRYPAFDILLVVDDLTHDPKLAGWLATLPRQTAAGQVRTIAPGNGGNHATRSNLAIEHAETELAVLMREEAVIVQEGWLEHLVRSLAAKEYVAAAPMLITPGRARITAAGLVAGLNGNFSSPESKTAKLGESGYLERLRTPHEASLLSSGCLLLRKSAYRAAGCMDEALGDHLAHADLCLTLRQQGGSLLVQPASTVVFGSEETVTLDYDADLRPIRAAASQLATRAFRQKWGRQALVDPFWNPNFSLTEEPPTLETKYVADWQFLPGDTPRILACPVPNGQGDFRITSPLKAACAQGLAQSCLWIQQVKDNPDYLTAAELSRLNPQTAIVQNYIHDRSLGSLNDWQQSSSRPFTVYALDDLITDLEVTNPFRKNIPANSRARFKYALDRCDRLVVSTEFLANEYQSLIKDIRIVPNRLEQHIWLPLSSKKNVGSRPRIGWAGGITHKGDLLVLKEIIERTRDEADWVFFGMCPEEIKPLLAEFHDIVPFAEYPARLASLNLDIAVAPLTQTYFNRGKSNLRLLEYGILGISVVCTDIEPYRNSPACHVDNQIDSWVEALRARIHDTDARLAEGRKMRDWVTNHFLLENHVIEWLEAHLP